jgi:hypothetical protein
VKAELTELCSHRLIATLIANPLELHIRQEVLHGDLQYFHYNLVYMHTPYPNIPEDMEFPTMLTVKQILKKLFWRNCDRLSLLGPLKHMLTEIENFC